MADLVDDEEEIKDTKPLVAEDIEMEAPAKVKEQEQQ